MHGARSPTDSHCHLSPLPQPCQNSQQDDHTSHEYSTNRSQQVGQESDERLQAVASSWQKLNNILVSHEAVIQKRWRSKTASKRRAILLNAWPDMVQARRPDFDAWSCDDKSSSSSYYASPLINVDDLSTPRRFLILLNARGRNPPEAFAIADHQLTKNAFFARAILLGYIEGYELTSRPKGLPWNFALGDSAGQGSSNERDLWPGSRLEVLGIQERLLNFLVACCTEVLHDIDLGAVHAPQPDPELSPSKHVPTLADQKAEDEFRLPCQINFESLQSLVAAKVEACEDHFVALREDPAYFVDTMTRYREHRMELLLNHRGDPHPSQSRPWDTAFWGDTLQEIIHDSHLTLDVWRAVQEKLDDLLAVQAKHASTLSHDKPLPEELLDAFLRLDHSIDRLCVSTGVELKCTFAAAPPMRDYFMRREDVLVPANAYAIQAKDKMSSDPLRKRLYFLFDCLWSQKTRSLQRGLELVVNELEWFLQQHAGARDLLTEHLQHVVSDFGIIAQAKREINLFQPWAASFATLNTSSKDLEVQRHAARRVEGLVDIMEIIDGRAIVEKAIPLSKFAYPSHKRRTQETVAAMRQAEENLDALWAAVDKRIVPYVTRHKQLSGLRKFLGPTGSMQLERTQPWKDNINAEQPVAPDSLAGRSLLEYYHDLERPSWGSSDALAPAASKEKEKVKTRGLPSTSSAAAAVAPSHASEPAQQRDVRPRFTVSSRAFNVFQTIFFTPNETSHPGEVVWTDFVAALESVGFIAQKLQGSIWQFRHNKTGKSILFHQPHPSPRLSFWRARFYGRRLTRKFGWSAGMFAPK